MKAKKIMSLILLILLFSSIALSQPFEYNIYSGAQVRLTWILDPDFTIYEFKLKNISNLKEIELETIKDTNQLIITIPKVGVYEIQGRMCKEVGSSQSCTEWSKSTNPSVSLVNGSSRAWVIRAKLAPAGKPVFEPL